MNQKSNSIQAHLFISGRVQGVGFRWQVQQKAQTLSLMGWTRNLWDGRVEVLFEGDGAAVRQAVTWCHTGDPPAKVDEVKVSYGSAESKFTSFRIRYDG